MGKLGRPEQGQGNYPDMIQSQRTFSGWIDHDCVNESSVIPSVSRTLITECTGLTDRTLTSLKTKESKEKRMVRWGRMNWRSFVESGELEFLFFLVFFCCCCRLFSNQFFLSSCWSASAAQVQLAARQSLGRQFGAELHAVHSGQPARLRQLGRHGQRRLVLRRRSALLRQIGRQPQSVLGQLALPRNGRLFEWVHRISVPHTMEILISLPNSLMMSIGRHFQ